MSQLNNSTLDMIFENESIILTGWMIDGDVFLIEHSCEVLGLLMFH